MYIEVPAIRRRGDDGNEGHIIINTDLMTHIEYRGKNTKTGSMGYATVWFSNRENLSLTNEQYDILYQALKV